MFGRGGETELTTFYFCPQSFGWSFWFHREIGLCTFADYLGRSNMSNHPRHADVVAGLDAKHCINIYMSFFETGSFVLKSSAD